MLKIGVLGAGHLGKIHLKLLQQSSWFDLVGFYDANQELANEVSKQFGYPFFNNLNDLISAVDIVDIVTPTLSHFKTAEQALHAGKHIFVEKPIATHLEEAKKMVALAKKYNLKGQVGHVERFNPAFLAVKDTLVSPMFIETHRLAEFNPRGTDVPVVLDLMIHDIDIILSVVPSEIKNIAASGVSVISNSPDIANARIAFKNGCVANLTASRISLKNMRKSRFFQKDAYISVDFLEKKVEVVKMKNAAQNPEPFDMILQNAEGEKKQIYFENPTVSTTNAILDELESFAKAIKTNTTPIVSLEDGTKALEVATQIIECFNK